MERQSNSQVKGGNCVNIPAKEKLKVVDEITMTLWVYYQKPWIGNRTHWFDKDCHTAGWGASYGIMSADIGNGPEIWLFLGSLDERRNTKRQQLVIPHKMDGKKWHHIAGSYDGKIMKIYVDGEIIGEEKRNLTSLATTTQIFGSGAQKREHMLHSSMALLTKPRSGNAH